MEENEPLLDYDKIRQENATVRKAKEVNYEKNYFSIVIML